jgi:hypothetical protein
MCVHTDTISINHNWANACNVDLLWATLAKDFHAVQKELDDCKDTEGALHSSLVNLWPYPTRPRTPHALCTQQGGTNSAS